MSAREGELATAGHARVICHMRYSKWALLVFGAGMVLGLAVVSAGLMGLARVASLTMAAGIVLLPIALIADWRRTAAIPKRRPARKTQRRSPPRRRSKARR
jgi:hypothetical protein